MAEDYRFSRYKELFPSLEDKAGAFDRIAAQFLYGNFGRMSKSDFETLIFSIYIDQCIKYKKEYDDYMLSRELGITQTRVRSLKVKNELQYPKENPQWKENFIECIRYARYDDVKHLVKLQISDVNVLIEVRNFVEKHGWYDEYQLNPKLFQCRADVFIDLCRSLDEDKIFEEPDKDTINRLEEIKKKAESEEEKSALDKIISGSIEEGMMGLVLSSSKLLLQAVLPLVPCGGLAKQAIAFLVKAIEKA